MSGEAPPLTSYAWRLTSAAAFVLLTFVLDMLGGLTVRAVLKLSLGSQAKTLAVGAILVLLYAVQLALVWAVARRHGTRLAESVGLRRIPRALVWLGSALWLAVVVRVLATVYSAAMLSAGLRLPGWDADALRYFPPGPLGSAMLVLIVVAVAPVVEEIVFRGIVLTSLRERWGDTPAILVSSFVFAALHLNLFSFLPIFAVAVVLSRLYISSRSLWVSMVCHSAFNGIGVIFLLVLRVRGLA